MVSVVILNVVAPVLSVLAKSLICLEDLLSRVKPIIEDVLQNLFTITTISKHV